MSNVVPLSRFRAELSRNLARQGAQLLARDDLHELVPRLEPLEAYYLVKEVGVDEALPVLRHSTTEQIQAYVDLDCWTGDRPDPEALDAWLAAFAQLGQSELASAFCGLDGEVQVVYLARTFVIYEAHQDEELPDPPEGVTRRATPDRYFFLETRPDEEREFDPFQLIEALYALDVNEGFRLLTAVIWEQIAALEEDALRFRAGRMEDLGFPARDVAVRIFARPASAPPAQVAPPRAPQSLPALYASAVGGESLLSVALDLVRDDVTVTRLEDELRNLVNCALVAYDKPPTPHLGAQIARHVRDTLCLGLELLLRLDTDDWRPRAQAAADLICQWPLFEIFRHGYRDLLSLQTAARQLLKQVAVAQWYAVPESQQEDYGVDRLDRECLAALLASPAAEAGFDPLQPKMQRYFSSRHQVRDVLLRLETIERRLTSD